MTTFLTKPSPCPSASRCEQPSSFYRKLVVAAAAPVTNSNTQPLNYSGDFLPASGTQTFVTVTAVPEPSTYVMLAIAAGIGAIAARCRRKSA